MLASRLKEKLKTPQPTIGPMMTFDFWAGYLEIYKKAGMDFVLVDLEHGSAGLGKLEELCRTARLLDLPLIVRPEATIHHLLRKYLDMGPSGFMVPWTESDEQVETLRGAMFTPPRGRRGPGGPSIYGAPTLDRAGWDEVEKNLFAMVQIESPRGIEQMGTFAAHDFIDAVMLGPYDLSLHLDHCWDWDHPELVSAITGVIQQASTMGKPCGMPVGNLEQARFWQQRGCHFFLYSEATQMARVAAESFVKEMRDSESH